MSFAPRNADMDFVRYLDSFGIHGVARERMLAMTPEDRAVLLNKWKRGSGMPDSSNAPPPRLSNHPVQTAPPRLVSNLARSSSGREMAGPVERPANLKPLERSTSKTSQSSQQGSSSSSPLSPVLTSQPTPPLPTPRRQSKLHPTERDENLSLIIALHRVLDSLGLQGRERDEVINQTTPEQKQRIVQKFFSRRSNPDDQPPPTPTDAIDFLKYIDEMPASTLDNELEIAFSDPDINMTGSVGTSLIRNMSDSSKRHFLKQFVMKKQESDEELSQNLRKLSIKTPPPRRDILSPQGSGVDESSQWRQSPDFFLKNISRRHESLRLLGRDLLNLRIHLSLATTEGINEFLDCVVDIDGVPKHWNDSLEAALERLSQPSAFYSTASSYRDSINIYDIRLSAVQCLNILVDHSKAVDTLLRAPSIISKIVFFLLDIPQQTVSDVDNSTQLEVKIAAVEALGPLCLASEDGQRLIMDALETVASELGLASRFLPIIASIVNPWVDRENQINITTLFLSDSTDPLKSFSDLDLMWKFRSSVVIFLVALVAAPEEPLDRLRIRFEMEAAGLNLAFRGMLAWDPTAIVREHIDLYYEDKTDDTEEVQQVFKELNANERSPEEVLSWVMDILQEVQCSNVAYYLVLRTLGNLANLTSLLATDPTSPTQSPIFDEIMREETINGLSFLQELTSMLYESNIIRKDDLAAALNRRDKREKLTVDVRGLVKKFFSAKGAAPNLETTPMSPLLDNRINRIVNARKAASPSPSRQSSNASRQSSTNEKPSVRQEPETIEQDSTFYAEEITKLKRKKTMALLKPEAAETDNNTPAEAAPLESSIVPTFEKSVIVQRTKGQKIRNVRWTKMSDEAIHGTIWESIVSESYFVDGPIADVIVDDSEGQNLAELFSLADQSNFQPEVYKPLLDPKRARNMEIIIRGLRVPFVDLRNAVLHCDDDILTVERLEFMTRCMPTDAEVETVTNYDGPVDNLGYAERFVITFASLECPREYIDSLILRQTLPEELAEAEADIAVMRRAVTSVLNSTRLVRVLRTVLVIGNYLNGWADGIAFGYDLDSLLNLMDIKADEQSSQFIRAPTLMHYIAKRLFEIDEDALMVVQDLEGIDDSSKVPIQSLMEASTSLNTRVTNLTNLLQRRSRSRQQDSFDHVMLEFSKDAAAKSQALSTSLNELKDLAAKMLRYFGADRKQSSNVNEVLAVLWKFCKHLQKAHQENEKANSEIVESNPLMRGLKEAKSRLKAVPDELPFYKRLTIAKGNRRPNYSSILPESGSSGGLSRANLTKISREPTMFRTVLAARKTTRRATTKRMVAPLDDDEDDEKPTVSTLPKAIEDLL
ncbi:hypothetical protein HDU97_002219 [Phlyctochytrium planicorne]|nr:hypothetical protein HDU97_002219 [Phlyctochytrium planicorne]